LENRETKLDDTEFCARRPDEGIEGRGVATNIGFEVRIYDATGNQMVTLRNAELAQSTAADGRKDAAIY